MYALLPIVRNTIIGLRGVDPAVVESAQGMGMGRARRLVRIELPLAWPVIIAGIRVSTQIAGRHRGHRAPSSTVPAWATTSSRALARVGSPNALNQVLGGTLGIVILAPGPRRRLRRSSAG